MRIASIITTAFYLSAIGSSAFAQVQPSENTRSSSGTATDTGKYQIYEKNGLSVGGYSTTTTTGGYSQGGSGQAIPNNTRGSSQDSSKGVYIQKRF